ncbi:membrane protein [Flavobacterium sp. UMI-01]|nr:membrane protein [Flavobacterium sp. UMI-01]
MMDKKIIGTGALMGMVAIILGAFGAHALKKVLTPELLATFETGVRYQMYQAIFLLLLPTFKMLTEKTKKTVFYLVVSGVVLFSGSIYGLATNYLTPFDFKTIGFVTPIGGFLIIVGWSMVFFNYFKGKS